MRLLVLVLALTLSGCAVHAAFFAINVIEESRNPQPMPSLSTFSEWTHAPPPAPMAPDRKINEQDCSKPIDYTLGNIKCK